MTEKKNAQAKILPKKYDQLQKAAQKENLNVSEFLRKLIDDAISNQEGSIKKDLVYDIATISSGWTAYSTASEYSIEFKSLNSIVNENWDYILGKEIEHIRDKIESANRVYIIGQGTSNTLANYFASQLRNKGIKASGHKAEEMIFNLADYEGLVIAISRSGETESVQEVSKKAKNEGMYVIANTSEKSMLSDIANEVIPVPNIKEATKAYTTKAACFQMIMLQEILLKDNPSKEMAMARVNNIETFLKEHIDRRDTKDERAQFQLSSDSPFRKISEELKSEQDLRLNPIFATIGRYYPIAFEFAHKMSQYLHAFSDHDSLGHVRDQYINILFNESGYLVVPIPPEGTQEYKRCGEYISRHQSSIDDLLKDGQHPKPLRLIAISMNGEGTLEGTCKNRSLYDNSLITLESFDPLSNDLIMFITSFLFTYAILSESWGSDPEIRRNVPRSLEMTLGYDDKQA